MSKITNDVITWPGYIAVPIWQQWASKGSCTKLLIGGQ